MYLHQTCPQLPKCSLCNADVPVRNAFRGRQITPNVSPVNTHADPTPGMCHLLGLHIFTTSGTLPVRPGQELTLPTTLKNRTGGAGCGLGAACLPPATTSSMWHLPLVSERSNRTSYSGHMHMQDYFNMRVMSKDVGALTISPHENDSVSRVCHASLALLLGTAPARPGLHSLHISGGVFNSASAALLSHALLNHSCLSHLSAPTLSWKPAAFAPSPAEAIYTILPQLSHLTSLTLSIAACASTPNSITIATIRSLASAISALPALASLVLSRVSAKVSSNTCGTIDRAAHGDERVVKRRRHTRYIGRPEVLTLDPVIAALSTAPALTALCLTCSQTMPSQNIPCSGIAGPFSSLCRLHLHFQAPDDYSRNVKRRLSPSNRIVHIAPMPALQSVTLSARHPFDKGDALVSTIISSAAQQPALTALRLELGRTCPSDSFHEAPAAQFQSSMSDEQLVKVDAAWLPTPARLHALVSELARLTRLHSLELQVVDHQLRLKGAASDHHPSMLQPLLGLQKLQDLCLRFEGPKKGRADTMMLALLAAPETALSKLTALSFRFEGSIHTAVVLSPKLPQLTALRRLSLWGLRCEAMKEVLASLRTSPQLEELEVVLQPVDGAVVRWFAEFAAQMPQLCVGRLGSSQTGPAEHVGKSYGPRFAMPDWIEGLLHLPGRGKFVIDVENGQVMEGALAVVREALESRGARVSRDCRQVEFQS